jgi:replicative DNA helicase
VDSKLPVAVFSLEMSKQQLAERLLSARSGVDSQRMRRNMLNSEELARLQETADELSQAPMFIDDTPGISAMELRAKARRLASQQSIQCIVIDYMQLMSFPGSESRQAEVSAISRSVKALARELRVPVICLSQLNRNPEGRESKKPMLSDLRESGSIEQDADVVMMLHREAYYHNGDQEWAAENAGKENVSEIIIAKQRNGPTGIVELLFDGKTTRFLNLSREWA